MAIDLCILHCGDLGPDEANTPQVGQRIISELQGFVDFLSTPGNVNLVHRSEFLAQLPGDDENVTYYFLGKVGGNGNTYGIGILVRRPCEDDGFDKTTKG